MKMFEEYKLINNRIEIIDCLKGFSIFTIVMMHLMDYMDNLPSKIHTLSSIGGTGVHVFFLCSGIGLYLSFLNKSMGYIDFLKKRFNKIYVPYIIIILISFLLPWMYKCSDRILALLSHVCLFKMFVPKFEQSFGIQFWFVSTIIQFYFLFIPMCKLKNKLKNNKIFFGIFLGISVVWWIVCYLLGVSDIRVWSSFCLQYIWEFALGFIIAEKLHEGKVFKFHKILLVVVAVVGIGMQAGFAMTSDALKLFNDIPALLGYSSLALALMNIGFIKLLCKLISKFSYEFFLVHILVIETVFNFIKPEGLLYQCIIGLVALLLSLIVGFGYNKFISNVIHRKKS